MLSAQVFKRKRLFVVAVIILLGYGIWHAIDDFLYLEQKIVLKEKVGSLSTLYVTQSSAGATTSNVYKYYLFSAKQPDAAFLKEVRNGYEPFLVTTATNVKFKVEDNSIHLNVSGDIFKFNNVAGHTFIYLNSSPF